MSNAMREAFEKAGVRPAEEQLIEIAIKAMVAHADDSVATQEAIWAAVQKDRALVAELFKFTWRNEVAVLVRRARSVITNKRDSGAALRPLERKAAVVLSAIVAEETRHQKEREAREAISIAEYKAKQELDTQKWLDKWRQTKIGMLAISEKPIWECSVGTVRAWLETEKRRWRTVELLIEGLPDDGRPIEYYRKPEEVFQLWAQAAFSAGGSGAGSR